MKLPWVLWRLLSFSFALIVIFLQCGNVLHTLGLLFGVLAFEAAFSSGVFLQTRSAFSSACLAFEAAFSSGVLGLRGKELFWDHFLFIAREETEHQLWVSEGLT